MLNEILIADLYEFTTLNQAHSWRADFDIPAFEVEMSCVQQQETLWSTYLLCY